jgi:hypothetical protein
MENTWDMSPASRKMFMDMFASSWRLPGQRTPAPLPLSSPQRQDRLPPTLL